MSETVQIRTKPEHGTFTAVAKKFGLTRSYVQMVWSGSCNQREDIISAVISESRKRKNRRVTARVKKHAFVGV